MKKDNTALTLFDFAGISPEVTKLLVTTEKRAVENDPNSRIKSQSLKAMKKSDLGTLLKLDGAQLDAAHLRITSAIKERAQMLVNKAAASQDWTGGSIRTTFNKSGKARIHITLAELNQSGPSDEDIAKATGMTIEAVREMREKQEARMSNVSLDIPATVEMQADQPAPAPAVIEEPKK